MQFTCHFVESKMNTFIIRYRSELGGLICVLTLDRQCKNLYFHITIHHCTTVTFVQNLTFSKLDRIPTWRTMRVLSAIGLFRIISYLLYISLVNIFSLHQDSFNSTSKKYTNTVVFFSKLNTKKYY